MPDVKEVYEMVTKQRPPEPGALERQLTRQRRRSIGRKVGAFAVAAAIAVVAVVLILANRPGGSGTTTVPADQPTSSTTAPGTEATVGTVTFDGSTCSMEITADRIEPGIVVFEVVNATNQRAMFDSWQLLDGYTVREFEATIERDRRIFEAGKPGGVFPDQEEEVSYQGSEVVAANDSGVLVSSMSSGRNAIVCLQQPLDRPSPFGVVGPIVIR